MFRRLSVIALAVFAACLAAPAMAKPLIEVPHLFQPRPKPPPPSLVFVYNGWRIDARPAARVQPPARTIRSIKTQIDIVEHVGLRPDVLAFMRAQPVVCDGASDSSLDAGVYVPGRGVLLRARRLDPKKPVLLYALLKAYLAERVPGASANAQLTMLRAQAAARHVWPKTARMLQGNDEFFALSAAAYLYGAITREPYSRADLRKTEPQTYQWLANLFDGGRPRI
jgi:hypothetical protein